MKHFHNDVQLISQLSLPSLGVWIETDLYYYNLYILSSLPSLGVWIETGENPNGKGTMESLPSLGVWIETGHDVGGNRWGFGHSLHWECGLKRTATAVGKA